MATYKQVSYGSQGSDVTELQKLLNKNGYNLKEDGIFGGQTQQAVRDYQQKNNQTPTTTTNNSTATTQENKAYQPSDAVTKAQELLDQQLSQKPGAYQSSWQTQLNDTINKILNREKFSYDLNGDAFYQQYKDKFTQQGKMAMMDTMAQAQAMTGGYGNSWAQSVGQQAYQGQLQNLNDVIPELYQMALDRYNQEGQDLHNQYAMLGAQEDQDYGRFRDQLGDWQTETDRLQDRYDAERDFDYGKYADDRAYAYQEERDKVADQQWQDEFDEAKRQYDQTYAAKNSGGSGGSSYGGGDYSGTTYDDSGLDQSQIKEMQAWYGTTADGVWGNQSTRAADGRSVTEAWEYYQANKDDGTTQEITTYKQLRAALDELVTRQDSNGNKVTKSEISAAIRDAVRYGVITQNQAQNLLNIYTPKGNTY
jgi:peptidoglycan hydrolase-like protein with peptidoglycan-binding domain